MKRLLLKLIVQPIWVDVDDYDNATEMISSPAILHPKDLPRYCDELSAYAERARRGEIEPPQVSDKTRRGEAISDG